ncbi:MAG TPA: porphobilinogen synthase [Candidatus Omnitrophica bacterium]|nr:MAG: delta-aminolevulinic acid dehydratase [Omnitrophica WOR_2 bacterium GWA2_45_18]OGX19779.1 MAG: delta-aminolevulinic acid dehydratase [Omnitrophica WOR_2 bacterium GWC2_45_7]HBR14273.1 porphobilinogen synthase [Candidatus Omnitrophota bacterium]
MGRFRRLRKTDAMRQLVRETILTPNDVIQPFFVVEGKNKKGMIASMPGIFRHSTDLLLKAIEEYINVGGKAGLFFGIPERKDNLGSQAYASRGVVQNAVKAIKKAFPEFLVITDICLCGYMDHGHCGVIEDQVVDNEKTLALLGKIAVSHAEAGSDIVAPSDMMDFRVRHIREGLDKNGFLDVGILSYAVKYSSSFYGPFREAADSSPQFGDRKTYQMDYANQREALKEARQDVMEGADMIMVKPALAYLDVIALLRKELTTPLAAYSVSGEYSMIKAAAAKNWINEKDVVLESLTAMKRAGADIIITYYAREVLQWIG